MTATMQRVREKTGEWSSIFPPAQISETQSALFIKKLLAVSVSNIMYLRTIFPENAFGDRCLEDLNLKILRDDSACPGACQVIKWVKGCFDALDKKYLRAMTLGIYLDPNQPDNVIESYTFKFSYQGDSIEIYRNDKKIGGASTEAETKKATTRLLRTILVLTQSLKSLPDDVIMAMKLLYYDDVTPPGYEPPGFQAADTDSFVFEEEPMNIKVGDVATPFHTLKVRVKTDRKQFELAEEDEITMETDKREALSNPALDEAEDLDRDTDKKKEEGMMEVAKEQLTHKKMDESQDKCERGDVSGSPHRPAEAKEAITPDSTSSAKMPFMTNDQEENTVRCPCGCNEDDGLMIRCEECRLWQHAVCFGIISEEAAPGKHICDQCAKIVPRGSAKPTDPYLAGLTPIVLQATCLWRRSLLAASEMSRVLIPGFSRRLGVEISVAHGLVNRLEKEGYCKNANKGKRIGKVVNRDKLLGEGFKKYFAKSQDDASAKEEAIKEPSPLPPKVDKPASQKGKRKVTQFDKLVEKTAELSMSERLRPRRLTSQESSQRSKNNDTAWKPKTQRKRVVPLGSEQYEFEVSSSQDPEQQPDGFTDSSGRKRRKSSIVTRSVMV